MGANLGVALFVLGAFFGGCGENASSATGAGAQSNGGAAGSAAENSDYFVRITGQEEGKEPVSLEVAGARTYTNTMVRIGVECSRVLQGVRLDANMGDGRSDLLVSWGKISLEPQTRQETISNDSLSVELFATMLKGQDFFDFSDPSSWKDTDPPDCTTHFIKASYSGIEGFLECKGLPSYKNNPPKKSLKIEFRCLFPLE